MTSIGHKRLMVVAGLLAAALWPVVGADAQPAPQPPPQSPATGQDEVSVVGNRLLRDGRPWIPHGFYQIAFEQPPTFSDEHRFWKIAARGYFPGEYLNMRRFGADSVRIQVSQPGMDPDDPLSTADYRQRVLEAIRAARAAGLIVIVSVQDERQSGEQRRADYPNDATRHVWQVIAPAFGHDRGVLFELLNEPHPDPSPAHWQAWRKAMERTIATVRSHGANNVVIADGLRDGQELGGAPLLHDPLGQVAYASHPYAVRATGRYDQTSAAWMAKFGTFAERAPVIISEWGLGYYCDQNTPSATAGFLGFLQAHGIGLEMGIWDWPPAGFRSVRFGFPHSQTSGFFRAGGGWACDAPGFGPGQLIQSWYRTGVPPQIE